MWKNRTQGKELQYNYTRVSDWMREKNPNHNPQIKFNVDKLTEKVYEENKINKSFLGILALNKILLAKKEVLESIVNISKEIHQVQRSQKNPKQKIQQCSEFGTNKRHHCNSPENH